MPSTRDGDEGLSATDILRKRVMLYQNYHTTNLPPNNLKRSKTDREDDDVNSKKKPFIANPSEVDNAHTKNEPFITKEKLREHMSSLRSSGNLCNSSPETTKEISACGLCGSGVLSFAPTPKHCSACNRSIKRGVNFYHTQLDSAQICVCSACFTQAKGGSVIAHGKSINNPMFFKRQNDQTQEEHWVECNECEGWQHQICGLYNEKSDPKGNSEYKCLKCLLAEMEIGLFAPSSTNAFFSGKDLKRTILSDHIECRLFARLKREREETAKAQGKAFDQILGAEDLCVRVVLSEKNKLEVNKRLLDVLQDHDYPKEFPYTTKLILLFQKIDGIDVCIFAIYVQEYGSECTRPNSRCAYVSYIDSVKYFKPNIKASTGESLRTFAYHELLIGYLDYIKRRGFTTCCLWSCPPRKGEEYMLYCRPETQKTPNHNALRQWYRALIKKATGEGVVVNSTTQYARFFGRGKELKPDMTVARLPYFDGDYFPLSVDGLLNTIEKERREDAKKAKRKKITKTSMKAKGLPDPSDVPNTDVLMMQKLEQVFKASKEDFIMLELQLVCSHCQESFLSGNYWSCSEKQNYHLCESCHALAISSSSNSKKHSFYSVLVDVPLETKDEDESLESDWCNNRSKFLTLCQSNNYQFDTLRRAKHSSMMILYHLRHLAQPPERSTSCHICHEEGVAGQCWSCKICPLFNVCAACYHQKAGSCHIHKLTPPPSECDSVG